MNIVYNREEPPAFFKKSIYLAGTSVILYNTTKKDDDKYENTEYTYRDSAINFLSDKFEGGALFVPTDNPNSETSSPGPRDKDAYRERIEWEQTWLKACDAVVFWLPRNLSNLGLCSNFELGQLFHSGKCFIGAPYQPTDNDKNAYLQTLCDIQNLHWYNDLNKLLSDTLEFIGEGSTRKGYERKIPLQIWEHDAFQHWKKAMEENDLNCKVQDVDVIYNVNAPESGKTFFWMIVPKIRVSGERRTKEFDCVIGRNEICSMCIYTNDTKLDDTEIVLIKEFRSSGRSSDGYVTELPSGSFHENDSMVKSAMVELKEETGIELCEDKRAKFIGKKQMMPTLCSTANYVYAYDVSSKEMAEIKRQVKNKVFGIKEESERTHVVIKTWKQIIRDKLLDWPTLGMIAQVLHGEK